MSFDYGNIKLKANFIKVKLKDEEIFDTCVQSLFNMLTSYETKYSMDNH